jgi:hypothetical protein
MARFNEPVVLELASLPREQTGPYLLLGLDKTADKETMESHWADRVRLARKSQLKVPLEDVNWARNMLADLESRLRADAASLNIDLSEAVLGRLAYRYGVGAKRSGPGWQPLDHEKSLADYTPDTEIPDAAAIAAGVILPEVPDELPAVRAMLEQLATAPLDPWEMQLPAEGHAATSSAKDSVP